jgi:ribosomal protein S15P/S13E
MSKPYSKAIDALVQDRNNLRDHLRQAAKDRDEARALARRFYREAREARRWMEFYQDNIAQQAAYIARLEAAVMFVGDAYHRDDCKQWAEGEGCTCGWEDAYQLRDEIRARKGKEGGDERLEG